MLYLAIPAHNEVATIGVLLWRLRTVLAEFPREYEVVVYDDASTDETAAVAAQYEQAMPVRVLRGRQHLGYAGATEALLRHIASATRYPRRDAVLLLQGDFTDPPVMVPEFARRFEGGADLVVGERTVLADAPVPVKRLFRAAQWAMRPFVRVAQVRDLTASMRLVRIAVLRDALRAAEDGSFLKGDTWTANTDLLLRLAPYARRVESVPMEPTYGVRMRETRRVAMRDGLAALKWAWQARKRSVVVGARAEGGEDRRVGEDRSSRRREARQDDRPDDRRDGRRSNRRAEPELSVERLREKVRDREGTQGLDGAPPPESRRDRQRSKGRDVAETAPPGRGSPDRSSRRERPKEQPRPVVDVDMDAPLRDPAEPPARDRVAQRTSRSGEAGEQHSEAPPRPEPAAKRAPDRGSELGPEQPRERRSERPAGTRPNLRPGTRPEPRASRHREGPPVIANTDLELDDPFAPPSSRRDRLDQVLSPRPEQASRPANPPFTGIHGQSAAPSLDSDETPSEPERVVPASAKDLSAEWLNSSGAAVGNTRARYENQAAERDAEAGDDPDLDPSDERDEEPDGEPVADTDGTPRKRRRNRRSRRGRRRRNTSESQEEGLDSERLSNDGGSEPVSETNRAPNSEADDDRDVYDDPVDALAEQYEEELTEDLGQRPRRRGRRGRRGGARRSRGRREHGDNDGNASGRTDDRLSDRSEDDHHRGAGDSAD